MSDSVNQVLMESAKEGSAHMSSEGKTNDTGKNSADLMSFIVSCLILSLNIHIVLLTLNWALRGIMLFFFIIVEIKARVDSMWEQMNKGVSSKTLKGLSTKRSPAVNKNSKKPSNVKIHILLLHNEAAQNIGNISLTFFSPHLPCV